MTLMALSLLSTILFINAQKDQPYWIGGTIYIREDGSVYPRDAPIERIDGDTYRLTSNVEVLEDYGIVIQRDNLILEGNRYSLKGPGIKENQYRAGIRTFNRANITIRNFNVMGFNIGIDVENSFHIVVSCNNVSDTFRGIRVLFGGNNTVANNVVRNAVSGIDVILSVDNTLVNNELWSGGILVTSAKNTVANNTVNGKPVLFLSRVENMEIKGEYGQIIVIGSRSVRITELYMENSPGISVWDSINVTIANNVFKFVRNAIDLNGLMDSIVENNTIIDGLSAIYMSSSSNVKIASNYMSNIKYHGIYLAYSDNNLILNNTINGDFKELTGILLGDSSSNTVKENTIRSAFSGISIHGEGKNTVVRNKISQAWHCIYVGYTANNTIIDNDLAECHPGVKIYESYGNRIERNRFTKSGILDKEFHKNLYLENIVNDKPVLILENISNTKIVGDYGQVVIINSTNLDISNLKISDTTAGLLIISSVNVTISENVLLNNYISICLYNSNNVSVIENLIRGGGSAIYLINVSKTRVSKNHVSDCSGGASLVISDDNVIEANTFIGCVVGVRLKGSSFNLIMNNTLSDGLVGVYTYTGLYDEFVTRDVGGSFNNIIIDNVIKNNYYGILLHGPASNNKIFRNYFLNNELQVVLDENVKENEWDDGSRGNYWSDHRCVDDNDDNICDNPYVIRDPDNIDRYPLRYSAQTPHPTQTSPTLVQSPSMPTQQPVASDQLSGMVLPVVVAVLAIAVVAVVVVVFKLLRR